MRGSVFVMAVSSIALLAGCTKGADALGNLRVAPQAGAAAPAAAVQSASTPLLDLARDALARGDAAAAAPFAARMLDTDPDNTAAVRVLAEATLMLGDPAKAEGLFRRVVAADAKSAGAMAGLGLSLLAQQRDVEAQSVLRDAAQLQPSLAVLSNIAFALTLAGAPEDAVALLEPVATNPQSTPKLRQNLAFALVAANHRARAFEVAGFDLDGVSAARQVAIWSETVRLPRATQVTQLAGLKVVDRPAFAQSAPPAVAPVAEARIAVAQVALAQAVTAPAPTPAVPLQKTEVAQVSAPADGRADVRADDIVITDQTAASSAALAQAPAVPVVAKSQLAKVKVLTPAAKAPVVQAVAFAMPSTGLPQTLSTSVKAVQKVDGWLVQVAAVRATTASALKAVVRDYRQLFGRNTAVRLVPVGSGPAAFHRVFIGAAQPKSAAIAACARLRAKGTACLVRDTTRLAAVATSVRLSKPAAPAVKIQSSKMVKI